MEEYGHCVVNNKIKGRKQVTERLLFIIIPRYLYVIMLSSTYAETEQWNETNY